MSKRRGWEYVSWFLNKNSNRNVCRAVVCGNVCRYSRLCDCTNNLRLTRSALDDRSCWSVWIYLNIDCCCVWTELNSRYSRLSWLCLNNYSIF